MSNTFAAAIATFLRKIAAAKVFIDSDLTPAAVARRRQEMASAAREELEAAIPPVRTDLGAARAAFIAAAFPKTADELALATGLLDLFGRKVAAGQPFARVFLDANEPTLRVAVALPDALTGVEGAPEGPEATQALQEQAFGLRLRSRVQTLRSPHSVTPRPRRSRRGATRCALSPCWVSMA